MDSNEEDLLSEFSGSTSWAKLLLLRLRSARGNSNIGSSIDFSFAQNAYISSFIHVVFKQKLPDICGSMLISSACKL